ncbi:DUF485 domain-containing protein [Sphingomonas endophytica]|uniref:Uncharacterized membrane protein (DUF485 family) n=1 Tax=Sphingomonas endophytica TaxID=869719 RepID=A0ABR6N012_9SPHN|nr:DUF485 domain-containing protein [Sphingomonas endophytica]MBB5724125.1 uncharacterized membrane protein (DUF485 family) [Sphingomonas endophytica]
MDDAEAARVAADPRYHELVRRRGLFTWTLTAVMLIAYLSFILLIAFDKALLARPIGAGVTSVGIVAGFAVIMLAIVLTAIYVRRAARDFDPLVEAVRAEHDA